MDRTECVVDEMMEREGEEQYRVSMRDTFILYDTLVHGIAPNFGWIAGKSAQYFKGIVVTTFVGSNPPARRKTSR
jgi:hypothetical protein